MLSLTLTKEQLQFIFDLLDLDLKTNGLQSLIRAVDLHNVLFHAKPIEPEEVKVDDFTEESVDEPPS